ncbi:MAG: hypothetical protein IK063_06750, partial [Clostridia bacterium]|nr:hypothetical protein [Clostridia bacterium]
MKTANELWENVQQEIKNNFSETVYNVWLSNMSLVSFDGEKAVIATDEFRIKIIMQKFMDNIKAAFETVTGFDVDVEFVNAEAEPAAQNSTPYDDASDDEEATFETFVVGPSNR